MKPDEMQKALREQLNKVRDAQCLLRVISRFDPGGPECRVAAIAEKELDEISRILRRVSAGLANLATPNPPAEKSNILLEWRGFR